MYSDEDLTRLRWLKTQLEEKGLKISEAVSLLQAEPPSAESKPSDVQHSFQDGGMSDLIQTLYRQLMSLNWSSAHETIDFALSLYPYEQVFHDIFVPILVRVGSEWETGHIAVAQEHFASQLLLQRIMQFFRYLPVDPRLPKALALCPEGEHHHIGLLLFSLFLRKKGVDVMYLGPNTPLHSLLALMEENKVKVVAISVSHTRHLPELESWMADCLAASPSLLFALGGRAFDNCTEASVPYVLSPNPSDWERWYQSTIASPALNRSH